MIKTNRFLGGVLLIAGTSIGAGMLALPLSTACSGFVFSFIIILLCWLFMLVTAFLFLEVNLAFPGEVNMITMAEKTLGPLGKAICWVTYLLLLYSLTAMYIAGSSSFFIQIIDVITDNQTPSWVGPLPLLIIFGFFVYLGTKSIDLTNRILMAGLIIAYFMLVFFVPEHIQWKNLGHFDAKSILLGIPVILTSFGYHIIIPSLTTYMRHNVKKLRLMIFIGSLIPLFVYSLWQFLFLGAVPIKQLEQAYINGQPVSIPLMYVVNNPWVISAVQAFTFFAIVTSFLGVSLSLSAFLRDGLKIKKTSKGKLGACLLTYIPPLIFVYSYKRGFMTALGYAAVFVAILLAIYPALMVWKLPNKKGFTKTYWGKTMLITVIIIAVFIAVLGLLDGANYLRSLINQYI